MIRSQTLASKRPAHHALLAFGAALALVSGAAFADETPGTAASRAIGVAGAGLDLPFSGGMVAGDLVFLSGALGIKPGESTASGTPAEQTAQALANLEDVMKEAGLTKDSLVSTTVYVSDLRQSVDVSRTLGTALSGNPEVVAPTRSIAEADIAVPGAVVEIAAVAARPGVEVETLSVEGWPTPTTGYSWGVRAGDTVFIAAQVGFDIAKRETLDGVGAQTTKTLENIGAVLASAKLSLAHLVACRVYLPDARDFGAMNEAWRATFNGIVPPTRATIRARMPNPAFQVGIQCIAERGDKKVVSLPGEDISRLPFSPALQVGETLYLSGFVGRGPDGYPAGLDAQTENVINRLAAHLTQAGMSFDDVVSSEVWLDDVRHYQPMNAVYGARIPRPAPARATVASRLMSPDARVEIAMIAIARDDS